MVKKKMIIEKSLELFAKQGFKSTSVQQITEVCGISKGAFYLSFESKDELIMAIVDHLSSQFISDIDHAVRSGGSNDQMLFNFYYTALHSFNKHSGLAIFLIMEQALQPNEEMFRRMKEYEYRMNRIILHMLDRLYENYPEEVIYDLLICINGFVRSYSELTFHHRMEIHLDSYVRSLVEKTNILAQHMTLPLMTKDMILQMKKTNYSLTQKPVDSLELERNRILALIEQELVDMKDPIEAESLGLLKDSLLSPKPSLAIVKGLLENIRENPQCKWISYLIREYYEL